MNRDLWGQHYFTERTWKVQLLNFAGHFGIGLGCAGLAGLGVLYVGFPEWATWTAGPVVSTIREAIQWKKSEKPHLFDRARDILESIVGAVTGWAVFALWIF